MLLFCRWRYCSLFYNNIKPKLSIQNQICLLFVNKILFSIIKSKINIIDKIQLGDKHGQSKFFLKVKTRLR